MDLTVEIDGDISTLEEALHRFTRTEILDGENKYKCGRSVSVSFPCVELSTVIWYSSLMHFKTVICSAVMIVYLPTSSNQSTATSYPILVVGFTFKSWSKLSFFSLCVSRCKSYERAKKKLKITEPPNVLTIALKRFQVTRRLFFWVYLCFYLFAHNFRKLLAVREIREAQ